MTYQPSHHLVPHRETPVPEGRVPLFPETTEPSERKLTIEERFALFHDEHPDVYAELVRLARQAKAAGRDKVGMKMLFEVVRWGGFIENDETGPKLNNIYTSRYARLIRDQEPDLADLFETRRLLSR